MSLGDVTIIIMLCKLSYVICQRIYVSFLMLKLLRPWAPFVLELFS